MEQQAFYSTGLAGHVPHHVTGRRSMSASPAFAAAYDVVEAIEPGPFHPEVSPPEHQTQPELVARLVKMNAELSAYIESLSPGNWEDYQRKVVARCCDLMELEHGYCSPSTVALLEEVHGINPTAEDGPVTGQYAEFSLKEPGYGMQ